MTRLPAGSAPDIKNRSFTVTALVDIPAAGADGTLIAQGGRFAGWSLYLKDGKLNYTHNWIQKELYTVASADKIPAGKSELKLEFDYDGGDIGKGGEVKLYRDGKKIGEGRVARTVPILFSFEETLDVGEDTGTPVSEVYSAPNKFSGKIEKLTLHVKDYDLRLKLKVLEMMRKAK
jgi:arylsulfatase